MAPEPGSGGVRVGVVGTGRWGRNLVRNFHRLGCLAAICDSDANRLRRTAQAYPAVPSHSAAERLVRSGGIDALAIATPAGSHHRLAALALASGLHVFVEKPMTTDLSAARRLARQASTAKLQLMTGHLLQYHPAFRALRDLVREGRLGALRRIVSHRLAAGPETPREHVLWEFAPHDVSMILACAGALPAWATCSGPAAPLSADAHCRIELGFRRGLRAETTVSWRACTKVQRFEARGVFAAAVFDDLLPAPSKLKVVRTGQPDDAVRVPDREPLLAECSAFVGAVRTGVAPPSGTSEGLRVMAVLDACHRSLETGRRVILQPSECAG